ncbi:MAG: hypothetical protein EP330_28610 [Deltaproteobacteria bacterium]|nr:MAG: hypothetical protein EP330_28610 [Deltaproteobacteria bacterium]
MSDWPSMVAAGGSWADPALRAQIDARTPERMDEWVSLAMALPPDHPAHQACAAWLATDAGAACVWLRGPVRERSSDAPAPSGPQTFTGHRREPKGAVVAGNRVVSHSEHELVVWDDRGTLLHREEGYDKPLTSLVLLPGHRVVGLANQPELAVLDLGTGTRVGTLSGQYQGGGLVDARGRLVTWGMAVHLWDPATCAHLGSIEGGHTQWMAGGTLLADGRLLTWSRDRTLVVWNLDEACVDAVLKGHRDVVRTAIELDDGRVASLSEDKTLKLWDVTPNPKKRGKPIKAAASLKTGQQYGLGAVGAANRLLAWFHGGTVQVWDVDSGARIDERKQTHVADARRLGEQVLSWGMSGLRRWTLAGDPDDAVLYADSLSHAAVVGDTVFAANFGDYRHVSLASGKVGEAHKQSIAGVIPAGDTGFLSWNAFEKTLTRHPLATSAPAAPAPAPSAWRNAAYLDEARYLTWDKGGTDFAVRDRRSGEVVGTWTGHRGEISGIRPLSDGRLVSWGGDGLHLWSRDGQGQAIGGPAPRAVLELDDGRLAATVRGEGQLFTWAPDGTPGPSVTLHKKALHGVALLSSGMLLTWGVDAGFDVLATVRSGAKLRAVARLPAPAHSRGMRVVVPDRALLSATKKADLEAAWQGASSTASGGLSARFALFLDDGTVLQMSDAGLGHLSLPTVYPLPTPIPTEATPVAGIALPGGRWAVWSGGGRVMCGEGTAQTWADSEDRGYLWAGCAVDGERFAAWADTRLDLWDTSDGHHTRLTFEHALAGVTPLGDGRFATWHRRGTAVHVHDRDGQEVAVLGPMYEEVSGIVTLPAGGLLVATRDGLLWRYDASLAPVGEPWEGEEITPSGLVRRGDRILLYSGGHTATGTLLEAETLAVVGRLDGAHDQILGMERLADGRLVVWGSRRGLTWVHRPDGTLSAVLRSPVVDAAPTHCAVGAEILVGRRTYFERYGAPPDGEALVLTSGEDLLATHPPRFARAVGEVSLHSSAGKVAVSGPSGGARWPGAEAHGYLLFPSGAVVAKDDGQPIHLQLHRGLSPIRTEELA